MMDLEPCKLLLVDDQPSNLKALEAILEPLGQTLVFASSGKEALKKVLEHDFAAILLDVQMPDMDGFETASLIRSRERSKHVPIIFLTAISKEERFVLKGYTVGAVDYLLKPFDPEVLRSKVSVFVELYRKSEIIRRQALLLGEAKDRELADVRRTSEERYQNLAESMPQIVWVAEADGNIKYVNRRWWECAARASARKGKPDWSDVLHAEDRGAFLAQSTAAIRAKKEWDGEFRFGAKDRGYRWHLVRVRPIRGGERISSWIGTSTDIHDRKCAEEALKLLAEASKLLASSLDWERALESVALRAVSVLGDACFVDVCDPLVPAGSGRVSSPPSTPRRVATAYAAGVARWSDPRLGLGAANAILTGEREVITDVDAELAQATAAGRGTELLRFLAELEVTSFIAVPIVHRDRVYGAFTFFNADSRRHYGPAEVALAEDLARRAAAAMESARLFAMLEKERAKLEDANRAKDVFLATLSHELRTPLNAMMGWTQILRSGNLDEARFRRAVETIDRNARAQAQLIADLLDVSRIVTGKLKVDALTVELAPIVEGALDAARPTAEAKKVALEADVDVAAGQVLGDGVRLTQVVGNLLSNAIKFTPPGGRIKLSLGRADGGRARIVVEDSGSGIAPEFLPHVFERFRQADSTTTRSHGGLGLGLAIVKHLVELHGGEVRAESDGLGKGARFVVVLPLLVEKEDATLARARDGMRDGLEVSDDRALRGLRVLLVEDDADGRELIEMLLRELGAEVTPAGDAQVALAALSSSRFDVVVSDIGLPGEDGHALVRKLRALPPSEGGRTPAIALTAYASREDSARALAAGFQAHVAKPVNPGELAAAIVSVLGSGAATITPSPAPVEEQLH